MLADMRTAQGGGTIAVRPGSRPWQQLLSGPLRDQALDASAAIASALIACREPQTGVERSSPYSLAYGDAGIALFLHYWQRAFGENRSSQAASVYLERAIAGMANAAMPAALFRGFAGVSWVARHIREQRGVTDNDSAWHAVDTAIEAWIGRDSTPTELLGGLGGALLYVAEHGVRPGTLRIFDAIVSRLIEIMRTRGGGRAWPVSDAIQKSYEEHLKLSSADRFRLSPDWLGRGMQGYYKLSLAHGCLGTAAALASAVGAGFDSQDAKSLIGHCAEFVLSQELPSGSASQFPNVPGTLLPKWTGGWCDGDIGIAAALFHIASTIGCDGLRGQALRLGRLEARNRMADVEAPNRRNYVLCHGACGRAHIFNRLYQTTGEAQFADAAHYWITHTLSLHTPGRGTGGFVVDEQRKDGALLDMRGFLMGAAGLGLTLAAACCNLEPEWDRVLVLSGRAS